MADDVLDALRRAVAAAPHDVALRLHLAELLLAADLGDEAARVLGPVLAADPEHHPARALLARAMGAPEPRVEPEFDWERAERELRSPDP